MLVSDPAGFNSDPTRPKGPLESFGVERKGVGLGFALFDFGPPVQSSRGVYGAPEILMYARKRSGEIGA